MRRIKKIIPILFVLGIFCVLLSGVVGQLVLRHSTLSGSQGASEVPVVTFNSVISGKWQGEFETYFDNDIKIRDMLAIDYNPLIYFTF